jgi:hypothetical protein
MAVDHFAASMDQAHGRFGQLLERRMPRCSGDTASGSGADHPTLKLGNFRQSLLDRVLNSANLRCNLIGG